MTLPQIFSFGIVGVMMLLMLWGRLRYDIVALGALLAAVTVGIVPADRAFLGFSDDIVVIVGSALLVSAAIGRSGVIEAGLSVAGPHVKTVQMQVVVLVLVVTVLSSFVKNIGALAMMIPVAFQLAKRSNTPPSALLMPMAFGSLLGGIVTLVGTSPNIIVSRVRDEILGEPFRMFDFAPVGGVLAVAGVAFLAVGYRLIPKGRRGASTAAQAIDIKDYTTEAEITAESEVVGAAFSELEKLAEGEVKVLSVIRNEERRITPLPDLTLKLGDTLLLQGEPAALERLVARAGLSLARSENAPEADEGGDEIGVVEAIVGPDSSLGGQSAGRIGLYDRYQINLLAVSRRGERLTQRLRAVELRGGDVLVLQGNLKTMPDVLRELDLLPLAERAIPLGGARRGLIAVAILIAAIGLIATGTITVTVGFFGAAVLLVLAGALPLREAYASIEWPILIMLGALIPVSESIRTTGGTDLIAGWLSDLAGTLPGWGSIAVVMTVAMAVTPFLNNAATVLIMAPIAASFAAALGYKPDAFLMAVAIGAACDFLTPIGHQCNTLVMGPGGYKFSDYARLGLPLSIIVVVVGVPMIMLVWPLK
jgi:di/tricarboxylate transporter